MKAFGSTRLPPPDLARTRLDEARRRVERAGADGEAHAALRAAERWLERSRYYAIARELGRIVGRCGAGPGDNRLVIVTGGGPGAMEAANRGAFEVGAASVGLDIALPHEQRPNPYLTPGLCFEFRYFALHKLHFMLRARALVALPGGFGTLDELFETLCLIQTGKREALPVVLIGEAFWRRAIDFYYLLEEGVIGAEDLALFCFAESASVPIGAEVVQLDIFSAHADQAGLLAWLSACEAPPRRVLVNHGEAVPADTLRRLVKDELGFDAHVPDHRESVELD